MGSSGFHFRPQEFQAVHSPSGCFGEDLTNVEFEIEAPHGGFWLREGEGPILLIGGGSGLVTADQRARRCRASAASSATLCCCSAAGPSVTSIVSSRSPRLRSAGRADSNFGPSFPKNNLLATALGWSPMKCPARFEWLGGNGGLQGYLCGPPGMIDAGVAALVTAGVGLGEIHYDKFTDASNRPS